MVFEKQSGRTILTGESDEAIAGYLRGVWLGWQIAANEREDVPQKCLLKRDPLDKGVHLDVSGALLTFGFDHVDGHVVCIFAPSCQPSRQAINWEAIYRWSEKLRYWIGQAFPGIAIVDEMKPK